MYMPTTVTGDLVSIDSNVLSFRWGCPRSLCSHHKKGLSSGSFSPSQIQLFKLLESAIYPNYSALEQNPTAASTEWTDCSCTKQFANSVKRYRQADSHVSTKSSDLSTPSVPPLVRFLQALPMMTIKFAPLNSNNTRALARRCKHPCEW